jgi:hypothetical protein
MMNRGSARRQLAGDAALDLWTASPGARSRVMSWNVWPRALVPAGCGDGRSRAGANQRGARTITT